MSQIFSAISLVIVWMTFSDAICISYAGLFVPSVSFFDRLSLKAYHVQWQPEIFVFPVGGMVSGALSIPHGSKKWGSRSLVVSAGAILAMFGMDLWW